MTNLASVSEQDMCDVAVIQYYPISEEEEWRVPILREIQILNMRQIDGDVEFPAGWIHNEFDDILCSIRFICQTQHPVLPTNHPALWDRDPTSKIPLHLKCAG